MSNSYDNNEANTNKTIDDAEKDYSKHEKIRFEYYPVILYLIYH